MSGRKSNPADREFIRALSTAVRASRMTEAQIAKRVGCSGALVSMWVNGRSVPSPTDVFRLEETLGVEPGDLSWRLGFLPLTYLERLARRVAQPPTAA